MSKTAVYRLYDGMGELLYVGMTWNPYVRFSQHAEDKWWWREVESASVEWWPTRDWAEVEEEFAIWDERPRYNIRRDIEARDRPRPGPRLADMASLGELFETLAAGGGAS